VSVLSVSERIQRPPSEVFTHINDSKARENPLITKVERLTEPPMRVGTRTRVTYEAGGHRHQLEAEIVEYAPPHRCVAFAIHRSERFEAHTEWQLTADGEGTLVTLTVRLRHWDIWGVLVWPLVARRERRRLRENLARFKRRVEAG
jgi:uncharacterized protein YndB with AHSA1/START domain